MRATATKINIRSRQSASNSSTATLLPMALVHDQILWIRNSLDCSLWCGTEIFRGKEKLAWNRGE